MLIVLDLPFKMPCRGRDVVYNQLLLTQTIPQLSKCCPFTPLSCCLWEELLLAPAAVHRCPFTGCSPPSPSRQPSPASGQGYIWSSVTHWACGASSTHRAAKGTLHHCLGTPWICLHGALRGLTKADWSITENETWFTKWPGHSVKRETHLHPS